MKSSISIGKLQEHRLPTGVLYAVTLLTSLGVAATNFCIVWSTWYLFKLRLQMLEDVISSSHLALSALPLAAYSAALAAVAAALVVWLSPVSAGGGLPEMKGYLNGSKIRGLFDRRAFMVRLLGTIAVVSSGMPVGREGPTISLGCNIGLGAVKLLARPYARRWVNLEAADSGSLPALLVDEERLVYAKRMGCAMGGAAAIAVIFDAPIGGFLYMLEEVTTGAWAPELTLRAFICTAVTCLLNYLLLNLCGRSFDSFLIFVSGYGAGEHQEWAWQDVPCIVATAAALGAFSALYTRALAGVWSFRRRLATEGWLRRFQPWAKVVEASLYAGFCALAFFAVSLLGRCMDTHGGDFSELRFNCPEGQFNAVAYLLLNGPEEAIKLFYSPSQLLRIHATDLLAVLVAYLCLNVGMLGLAVPMGSFIPSMFIGAVSGRLVGHLLNQLTLPLGLAKPSVYALMGSAAMLGGSLRQTLSIVVFLAECINDMSLVPVLMVSVFVSHMVANLLGERGLDEELIVRKGVRYLDAELPKEMDTVDITAADLCAPLPASARLAPVATLAVVQQALRECDSGIFPVLDAGRCLGLVTRKRLATVVCARRRAERGDSARPRMERQSTPSPLADEDDDLRVSGFIADLCRTGGSSASSSEHGEARLALHRIMDKAPFTLLETMPVPRLHPLFTRIDVSAACVVSTTGDFVGLLTRSSLIDAVLACEGGHAGVHAPAASAPEAIVDVEAAAGVEAGSSHAGDVERGLGSAAQGAGEDCDVSVLKARVAQLEAALAAASAAGAMACNDGVARSRSISTASASPTQSGGDGDSLSETAIDEERPPR